MVIPVFIPHKGCPFDCIYCNQKAISGQIEEMTGEKIISIIESHISSLKEDTYAEIGFYGGSFTGIEKELQVKYLSIAKEYVKKGLVKGIRLSTRPDYIDTGILQMLKAHGVKTIELGVQSMDDEVLRKSCRGHTSHDVIKSSHLIKEAGISLGIQTMIGLPGSTREIEIDTANKIVGLEPDILRIYPTLVIKGTYLMEKFVKGIYKPLELDQAVDICSELLAIYNKHGINVIRIGLQPTDNINENLDVIAGPFHPSFRQLVESKLIVERIENYIKEYELSNVHDIIIFTGKENISNVIGQRRENVEYLKKKYKFRNIIIKSKEGLGKGIFIEEGLKD